MMKLLENGWIVEHADNRSEIHQISIGKISYEYSLNKQLMGTSKNPNFVTTLCCSQKCFLTYQLYAALPFFARASFYFQL